MARDKKKVSRKKNERLPFIFAPQSVERSVHALCERKKDAPGNKETARRPYQSSSSHPPPAAVSALPDVPRVVYTHSENEQYTFPLVGKTCCFLHLDRLFIPAWQRHPRSLLLSPEKPSPTNMPASRQTAQSTSCCPTSKKT